MKINSFIHILFIFLIVFSCKSEPTEENLTKILNSEKSTIKLITSHGNIVGTPNRSESDEKFEITNGNNEIRVKYFVPSYHLDSIIEFDLNNNEIDSLIILLKKAIQTHNPNKEYGGCCMCSNIDFYIFNDNIKIEVKPSEEIEKMYYDLIGKYSNILSEERDKYYDKLE